jgi:hypothetical protein
MHLSKVAARCRQLRLIAAALTMAAVGTLGVVDGNVLGVAGASAAPAATGRVTSCADTGPGSLRQVVGDAASGETITFSLQPSCNTIVLSSGEIPISRSLTISGPGASTLAVSACPSPSQCGNGGISRIFDITSSSTNVSLSGLTIEHGGNTAQGGAIDSAGTLHLSDCDLNYDTVNGGGKGGAIFNAGTLDVSDGSFSNYSTGDNDLATDGGGIYNTGTLTITGSIFHTSTGPATPGSGGPGAGDGGAIYNDGGDVTVSSTSLAHSSAGNSGGEIYNASGDVTITSSDLSDSDAGQPRVPGAGGAIYNAGTVDIRTSTLDDDTAGWDGDRGSGTTAGGAIFNLGTLSISDTTLANDHTTTPGGNTEDRGPSDGGAIADLGSLTVQGSTFSTDYSGAGGALYVDGPGTNATVTTSTFSANVAATGGAVYAAAVTSISSSTLADNEATLAGVTASYGPPDGGAIYNGSGNSSAAQTTIANSTLWDNSAAADGGAIYQGSGSGTGRRVELELSFVTIAGNRATSGGGIFAANNGNRGNAVGTIFADSKGGDCVATGGGGGQGPTWNLADDNTCSKSFSNFNASNHDIVANAKLATLAANGGPTETVALLAGSPAIGFVTDASVCPPTDQRGVPRTDPCDIGAWNGPLPKTNQTVTFTTSPPSAPVVGDTYNVVATASSGLPVTLVASGACTISSSTSPATVDFTGAGSCEITASQAGNATYSPAPTVDQAVSIAKRPITRRSQTVTFSSAPPSQPLAGGTYGVVATASSGLPVTVTVTGPCTASTTVSPATVDFSGVGTCVITAYQAGNANFKPSPTVTQTITIGTAPSTVPSTHTGEPWSDWWTWLAFLELFGGLGGLCLLLALRRRVGSRLAAHGE